MALLDKTLFIKKDKGDILLVQVYVDDIICGSTKKSLCAEFEQMMHKRFQMSSMRELTFFLGLQVKQKDDGIFISQDKFTPKVLTSSCNEEDLYDYLISCQLYTDEAEFVAWLIVVDTAADIDAIQ
ncbi:putative ribonuclease H-like domain-containing protein [Tanacetum coccineum]|uniref:Ribonuclease H-like domain-containing protein n=1 Tax=Tanacetum coccineum TaxID=301880 RepID=A0ABQ4XDZ4_9ASTR